MSIKYAILGLLHYSNMHGYRIKEHLEKNFGHMWSVNFGQIYPNLKELESEELVTMVELRSSENGGPHKKLYAITEKGKEEFSRWLEESPDKQMLLRDPFLLKFAFMGFGNDRLALKYIDEQIAVYESQHARRAENRERWRKQGVHVQLLAELGIEFNEMYLTWLRRAREEIGNNAAVSSAGKR
ncbi:MAG: PadR family transcriptional regulator [Spirochaetes bacterium]|nr:MAG: PadR family transcriptional regulator [Spirochaetota bacterium]